MLSTMEETYLDQSWLPGARDIWNDLFDTYSFTSDSQMVIWNWNSSVELPEQIKRLMGLEDFGAHITKGQ